MYFLLNNTATILYKVDLRGKAVVYAIKGGEGGSGGLLLLCPLRVIGFNKSRGCRVEGGGCKPPVEG